MSGAFCLGDCPAGNVPKAKEKTAKFRPHSSACTEHKCECGAVTELGPPSVPAPMPLRNHLGIVWAGAPLSTVVFFVSCVYMFSSRMPIGRTAKKYRIITDAGIMNRRQQFYHPRTDLCIRICSTLGGLKFGQSFFWLIPLVFCW